MKWRARDITLRMTLLHWLVTCDWLVKCSVEVIIDTMSIKLEALPVQAIIFQVCAFIRPSLF